MEIFFIRLIILFSIIGKRGVSCANFLQLWNEKNVDFDSKSMIMQIAIEKLLENQNFGEIAVVNYGNRWENVSKLLEDFQFHVICIGVELCRPDFIVITIENFKNLENFIKNFSTHNLRFRVKILIIFNLNESQMREIFQEFFRISIFNISILSQKNLKLFTFFPFNENSCNNTIPTKINEFIKMQWKTKEFYPDKLHEHFYCPLKITTFHTPPAVDIHIDEFSGKIKYEGLEFSIIYEIANHFKLKLEITSEQELPKLFPNSSALGGFKSVINGDADIAIGFLKMQKRRAELMGMTYPHASDKVIIIVSANIPLGPIEILMRPLQFQVWIYFTILVTVSLFISIFASRITKLINVNAIDVIAQVLGLSQTRLPVRNFARIILGVILVSHLIIRTGYTGELYRILKSNPKKHVQSIEDLIENDFDIFIWDEWKETNEEILKVFAGYEKIYTFPLGEFGKYREKTLKKGSKVAMFDYRQRVRYLNKLNYKKFTYKIINENFMLNQIIFCTRKDFPMIENFNEIISRMHSSGLIRKWITDKVDYEKVKPDNLPKKLNISHLEGTFKILIYGWIVGFSCFCIEWLIKIIQYFVTKF